MNFEELQELLKYIEDNNGWKNTLIRQDHNFDKPLIKYVDFCMDTRDSEIWQVVFRSGDNKKVFNGIDAKSKEGILKEIYDYLNGK